MSANTTTPTSTSSIGSISPNSAASGTEDIQYLLYLETLRRFRDDELNIKRQVEEKTRQYLEVKEDYLQLYAKYVKLTTLAATRCALLTDNHLSCEKIANASKEVQAITKKLATGDVVEAISETAVKTCKHKLDATKAHEKLKQLSHELAESKATVRAVQSSTEAVEATIETATLQSLDYFVDEVGNRN
ncbi:augmin complex subunit dgt4 [Zeugodacus cucurbitae]|uniref:augmin complex subunit dgt4 n=1 Tax=Zeugodacus cucurbitae TaxID=28588 RepID=UPI0023D942A3|nr:augmin complex subunit dgt4 [Zeugodacus cucurbitae]